MPIVLRLLGIPLALAYALERARFASVRLRWWVLASLWAASVYNLMLMLRDGPGLGPLLIIFAALLLSLVLVWAHRRRYVLYHPSGAPPAPADPPPAAEEKLFLRASGLFEVNQQQRYLVSVPVVFWTTRLGDHIVAARVSAPNLLGVGVPGDERGWWYAFVEPRQILSLTQGLLYFGLAGRHALALRYATPKASELLYLTCPDAATLRRVVAALQAH